MLNYKSLHSKIEEQETNAIYYLLRKFGLLQETVILSKVSSVNGKYGIYKYDTENEKLIISNVELATFYKVTFTIFDSNNNIRKVDVTGKETNGKVNITIPYITSKETLLEKIEVVITYAREIKPISYPYELNVSLDKDIIRVEESAIFSCKLLEDNVGIGGETLSYKVIKDSVIDSGSVVTDANGEATISYTGTGVGQIEIVISYGIFLQETYEVWDYLKYDKGILSDYNDSLWSQKVTNATFTRETDYSELLLNEGVTKAGYIYLVGLSDNLIIDFDFYQVDGMKGNGFLNVMNSSYSSITWFSIQNIGLGDEFIGKWLSLRLELNSNSATLTYLENPSKTMTKEYTSTGTPVRLRFVMGGNISITSMRFKNIKIYSI